MKPEHMRLLRDRFWRLNNLYFITDKQGKKVRFRMTQEPVSYTHLTLPTSDLV